MDMYGQHRGFTLIELIMVIVLLAALALTVIPRFVDLSGSASRAVVDETAAVFDAAMHQVNLAWHLKGFAGPGLNDNVIGFGLGNVDVNASGWPTDTNNVNAIGGQARCVRLWRGILAAAPSISRLNQPAQDTDFKASSSAAQQRCIYTYQRDSVVRSFTYHANTGTITRINP